jgi:hypothetical protein
MSSCECNKNFGESASARYVLKKQTLSKVHNSLELAFEGTFNSGGNRVMNRSTPVGFKRSLESGVAFGDVREYHCAQLAQRSKQTLTATMLLRRRKLRYHCQNDL